MIEVGDLISYTNLSGTYFGLVIATEGNEKYKLISINWAGHGIAKEWDPKVNPLSIVSKGNR